MIELGNGILFKTLLSTGRLHTPRMFSLSLSILRQADRDRERDRERQRETETQTQTDRQRKRQTETETHRETNRRRHRQTDRNSDRDRNRRRQRETKTEGDTDREKQHRDKNGERQRGRETEGKRDRQTDVSMVDSSHSFHIADYCIFGITLALSIAIGIYYSLSGGRQRTTDEYLLGGRVMRSIPLAISLLVSYDSSTLTLGLPAEMYVYGVQLWWSSFGLFVAVVFACLIMVPLLYPLKIASAYEVST